MDLFTAKEAARLLRISYRQVQYPDKTGFIPPSGRIGGRFRRYTFGDLCLMSLARGLRDWDVGIARLRRMVGEARMLLLRVHEPLCECTLLVDRDLILLFTGDLWTDELTAQQALRLDFSSLYDLATSGPEAPLPR
ncbi:MAG: MerR family transcriptional regulator [Candidatus Riflebacteria bacterium]|nr:MerR family transcriptional regulator [Candidatus Riflebacteria bacterium]